MPSKWNLKAITNFTWTSLVIFHSNHGIEKRNPESNQDQMNAPIPLMIQAPILHN